MDNPDSNCKSTDKKRIPHFSQAPRMYKIRAYPTCSISWSNDRNINLLSQSYNILDFEILSSYICCKKLMGHIPQIHLSVENSWTTNREKQKNPSLSAMQFTLLRFDRFLSNLEHTYHVNNSGGEQFLWNRF